MKTVLARLLQHQLYVKGRKCAFHQTNISLLGYIIRPEGVQMEKDKTKAMSEWSVPWTNRELQRLIDWCGDTD